MFVPVAKEAKKSTSVRDIGRVAGVSSATVQRFKSGNDVMLSVARKLLPVVNDCPCCGKRLNHKR